MSAPGSIILRYITAMVIVGIAVLTAATSYNIWKEIGQVAPFDARASAYFEQYSEPDCRFEGTWHDWERDQWMTLGCLKVKDEHREGSYRSATGARAISQVSMQGTYRIDGESFIHIASQDSEEKSHAFSAPISVENVENPTQVCFTETTEGIACIGFFIWQTDQ